LKFLFFISLAGTFLSGSVYQSASLIACLIALASFIIITEFKFHNVAECCIYAALLFYSRFSSFCSIL